MAVIIPFEGAAKIGTAPQVLEPVFTAQINGVPVRYFVPPSAQPDLPWCAFADLGAAFGWDPDQIRSLTWRLVCRWMPWLKAVATAEGSEIIVPCLGVAAILTWCDGDAATGNAILEGFAEAFDRSLVNASPSERFQAIIVAAREAASPGEYNALFDDSDAEQSA